MLISVDKSLGELKLGNCKPADTHSDGAIEAKDFQLEEQEEEEDVKAGEDYLNHN